MANGMKTIPTVAPNSLSPRFWKTPAFRFVGKFLLFLILLGTIYSQTSSRWDGFRNGFTAATARVVSGCYSLAGGKTSAAGSLISGEKIALQVIEECTGAYEMIIFAAAVLAFPTGWRKKGWGIVLGLPLLYGINILRMMLLAYVQAHGSPNLFDFMHIYFWQATLILMILGVFLLWIKLAVYRNVQTA
jgi:archaeosortase B (VPXXXP-CTERM-specific)